MSEYLSLEGQILLELYKCSLGRPPLKLETPQLYGRLLQKEWNDPVKNLVDKIESTLQNLKNRGIVKLRTIYDPASESKYYSAVRPVAECCITNKGKSEILRIKRLINSLSAKRF